MADYVQLARVSAAVVVAWALCAAGAAAQDAPAEAVEPPAEAQADAAEAQAAQAEEQADEAEEQAEEQLEARDDAVAEADAEADAAGGENAGATFYGTLSGEYQVRGNAMSDIPLAPLTTDGVTSRSLGQNYWIEQWIRVRAELGIRPYLKLVGQLDLLNGVVAGDLAQGVSAGERPRDDYTAFTGSGVRPRWLYLDWTTPIGLVRAGVVGSYWGLGILANDGDHAPIFGDYRYGDLVARVAFATRPLGRTSPFVVALAGDYVLDDITANAFDGDRAWQAVLAAYYEKDERRLGLYGVYRTQKNELGDYLRVGVVDVNARWDTAEPSGGRVFFALEAAFVFGTTTLTRSIERDVYDVRQLSAVAQLGRHTDRFDVVFEAGYTSGDSNTLDGVQSRATLDPDHRVGLVLFPEVLAAMTARIGTLAASPELVGRPPRGADLLPSNGGVQGAMYLFPHILWRPRKWLEVRLGAVLARATTDVIDAYAQRARSENVSYRGGNPAYRDLGLELDSALLVRGDIATGVSLSGGVEGGILFTGRALDDAAGQPMDDVGLVRLRGGLSW